MVREIGVHDDDKAPCSMGETVDVGRAEAEFARTGFQDDVRRAVELLELFCDFQCAVRGSVVHDDDFIIQLTTSVSRRSGKRRGIMRTAL